MARHVCIEDAERVGRTLTMIVWGAGLLSIVLGLIVLFGWHAHNLMLIQVLPAFVPMQYNTAVGFVLCGLALLLGIGGRPRLARTAGATAALLGILTLAEYALSINLGIDELLQKHYVTVETSHPGRMAPNTAMCFALIGLASVSLGTTKRQRFPSIAATILGSLAFGLGVVALSGYLTKIETAYAWGQLTRMAIHTATGFIVVSTGTVCLVWRRNITRDSLLPRWLPIPICLGVFTVTVCFWQAFEAEFALARDKEALSPGHSLIADVLLVVGILLGMTLALAAHLARTALRQAREKEAANQALLKEIGERKRLEEQREQLINRLEAQNTELERFAYTVSHDLKTPLITISGFIRALRDDLENGNNEAIDDDLARMSNAANRMAELIENILQLSRIGQFVSSPQCLPLGELAREVVELVNESIEQTKAKVVVSPDLPTVFGDRIRLLEVLQNLIENAVKYLGDQPEPRIEIGVRSSRDETVCFVRDNGIGIDPSDQEKVFHLFGQLDRRVEGSGIGLALVKRIIEVHGGRIWVESKGVGHGSTFCFTLPSKLPSGTDEAPSRSTVSGLCP